MPLEPFSILVDIRRVHTQKEGVRSLPVHSDVIHHPSGFVAQESVPDAPRGEGADAARQQRLEGRLGRGAFDVELSHVGDVEETGGLAHGAVLVEDGAVLHGHGEAREGHDARPEFAV